MTSWWWRSLKRNSHDTSNPVAARWCSSRAGHKQESEESESAWSGDIFSCPKTSIIWHLHYNISGLLIRLLDLKSPPSDASDTAFSCPASCKPETKSSESPSVLYKRPCISFPAKLIIHEWPSVNISFVFYCSAVLVKICTTYRKVFALTCRKHKSEGKKKYFFKMWFNFFFLSHPPSDLYFGLNDSSQCAAARVYMTFFTSFNSAAKQIKNLFLSLYIFAPLVLLFQKINK